MPQLGDIIKGGVILTIASLAMWAIFIKPHSYDWQSAGQIEGDVKTLLSNSKVIGQPVINAVVTFDTGGQTVVAVPLKSDVRQGDRVILAVQEDADKPARRRYQFVKETP